VIVKYEDAKSLATKLGFKFVRFFTTFEILAYSFTK